MTQATNISLANPHQSKAVVHYYVAMPQPESHLFEVTMTIAGWQSPLLDLKMPVWTPGSYLVREYSRHLQGFAARSHQALPWQKISKNHWQVDIGGGFPTVITVRYDIYANDLTVRTNHLDTTHGYFNGAALFFYVPGLEAQPVQVTLLMPHPTWQVSTALPLVSSQAQSFTFAAPDFDTLVDSPFEIGTHAHYSFTVLGKPHEYAVWGQGNFDAARVIQDTTKIIEVEAELFDGLPYDRYLFLLHLSSQGNGGLEHRNSCTLNYPRFSFRTADKYQRFMQLVAHEFFHLWNIKRIRPKALEPFDYERENYTPSLWFSEGTTSYYDHVIPFRAGIYDAAVLLQNFSKEITRLQTTPGRLVQSASEASFDAWIKLYRPDAHSPNSQISYYLKGEVVSLLLDLLIRQRHQNRRSLDHVMRLMWQRFGIPEIGFTPEDLRTALETIASCSLESFYQNYIDGTAEIPYASYLEPFGLTIEATASDNTPFWGATVKTEHGRDIIKLVEQGSPAQQAGLEPGDELLALQGFRVAAEQLNDRLKDFRPGAKVQFTVFHHDELRQRQVTLADPRPTRYQIVPIAHPTAAQEQLFQGWLGVSLSTL